MAKDNSVVKITGMFAGSICVFQLNSSHSDLCSRVNTESIEDGVPAFTEPAATENA